MTEKTRTPGDESSARGESCWTRREGAVENISCADSTRLNSSGEGLNQRKGTR
jgi:hypothetical protein